MNTDQQILHTLQAILERLDAIHGALVPETKQPTILTVKQAAAYLNVSQNTIYGACQDNTLKHMRIGKGRGTIRVLPKDLDNYQRQATLTPYKDYLS